MNAAQQFGTERVWTQAVLEYFANAGLVLPATRDEAYAKLVGFNFAATHFNSHTMIAALRIANGSTVRFPMQQLLKVYAGVYANEPTTAIRILAEFTLFLFLEPLLPETKCEALRAILDTFPADERSRTVLRAYRRQMPRVFALNPIAEADFARCFDAWDVKIL